MKIKIKTNTNNFEIISRIRRRRKKHKLYSQIITQICTRHLTFITVYAKHANKNI